MLYLLLVLLSWFSTLIVATLQSDVHKKSTKRKKPQPTPFLPHNSFLLNDNLNRFPTALLNPSIQSLHYLSNGFLITPCKVWSVCYLFNCAYPLPLSTITPCLLVNHSHSDETDLCILHLWWRKRQLCAWRWLQNKRNYWNNRCGNSIVKMNSCYRDDGYQVVM